MTKTKTSPDEQLSTTQAGIELGITKSRVLILISEGRLPATRVGKFWAIRRGDLDAVRDRPTGRPRKNPEAAPKSKKPPKRG